MIKAHRGDGAIVTRQNCFCVKKNQFFDTNACFSSSGFVCWFKFLVSVASFKNVAIFYTVF